MHKAVEIPGRNAAGEKTKRAITRGDLAESVDTEIALDLILGPIVLRQLIREQIISDADVRKLERVLKAGIAAAADQV